MGRTGRVVLVGGRGVGKTALLERAIYGSLLIDKPYIPTIEDIYAGLVENERGVKEKIRFYDTGGIEVRNRALASHYHAAADAYILVYSVTDKLSFQLLPDIKKDIEKNRDKKDVPIIVLGNKKDMIKERVVEIQKAESWATHERLKYFETSVLDRNSILDALQYICSRLNQQPTKTAFPQLSISRKNKE